MKIAIITQPLMVNYGGLLQNWALQQVLIKYIPDADPVTFDQVDSLAPWYYRAAFWVKRTLGLVKNGQSKSHFDEFKDSHIKATEKVRSLSGFKRLDKRLKPDAYIVGSDQVWRPGMVFNLRANFLGFNNCAKKMAYAASFGVDIWEFNAKASKMASKMAKQFNWISVREKSGIDLCRKGLGVEACHVLDPTLLLDRDDYMELADKSVRGHHLFSYILDTDESKSMVVANIIKSNNYVELNAGYDCKGYKHTDSLTVGQWIQGIATADFVVCDSFHGTAFSIIFNRPFVVLSNCGRGNARLQSILELFSLEDRLISSVQELTMLKPIDWSAVNARRMALKNDSINFLKQLI